MTTDVLTDRAPEAEAARSEPPYEVVLFDMQNAPRAKQIEVLNFLVIYNGVGTLIGEKDDHKLERALRQERGKDFLVALDWTTSEIVGVATGMAELEENPEEAVVKVLDYTNEHLVIDPNYHEGVDIALAAKQIELGHSAIATVALELDNEE